MSGRCRRVPKVRSRQLEHSTACWPFGGAEDAGLRPLVRATRPTGSPDPGAFPNTYPFIGVQVSVNERVALKSSIQNCTYDLMVRMHTMPDAQRLHHSLGIESLPTESGMLGNVLRSRTYSRHDRICKSSEDQWEAGSGTSDNGSVARRDCTFQDARRPGSRNCVTRGDWGVSFG